MSTGGGDGPRCPEGPSPPLPGSPASLPRPAVPGEARPFPPRHPPAEGGLHQGQEKPLRSLNPAMRRPCLWETPMKPCLLSRWPVLPPRQPPLRIGRVCWSQGPPSFLVATGTFRLIIILCSLSQRKERRLGEEKRKLKPL